MVSNGQSMCSRTVRLLSEKMSHRKHRSNEARYKAVKTISRETLARRMGSISCHKMVMKQLGSTQPILLYTGHWSYLETSKPATKGRYDDVYMNYVENIYSKIQLPQLLWSSTRATSDP